MHERCYHSRVLANVELFGIDIVCAPRSDILRFVLDEAANGRQLAIVTLNAEMIVNAHGDDKFMAILKSRDFVIPDGQGIARTTLKVYRQELPVYPGIEFAYDLLLATADPSSAHPQSVFLLGSKDGIAQTAKANLEAQIPDVRITGFHHGYIKGIDDEIVKLVNESGATILFAGMGSPFQEEWLERNRSRLNARILVGVGGCFEVWAGVFKRAPKWINRIKLEWLYRALIDPKRMKRLAFIPKYLRLERKEIRKCRD